MELKTTILCMIGALLVLGIGTLYLAMQFGRQYKAGGGRSRKYLCVCFTVACCVCTITAIQILFMFRNILFAA